MDPIEEARQKLDTEFEEELRGCWVVAGMTGIRYLGRVCWLHGVMSSEGNFTRKDVVLSEGYIGLSPVLEFHINLVQGPNGQVGKTPVILPVDLCMDPITKYLYQPTLLFFEDMGPQDLKDHRQMVREGLRITQNAERGEIDTSGPRIVPARAVPGRHPADGQRGVRR